MTESLLLAGAAEADITPVLGTQIAGNIGVVRPADCVEDRLLTRAIVLESGQEPSLLPHPTQEVGTLSTQELHRQEPSQVLVPGQEDGAHAPRPQDAEGLVFGRELAQGTRSGLI